MAMTKQRKTSNVLNILNYDDAGNIVIKDYGQVTRYSWNGLIHGFVGPVSVSSVSAATTDTDKFLVSDGGVLKYRTGAEVLSDIGGQPAGSYVPTSRTLTINGTAYDLSADRTFTIPTLSDGDKGDITVSGSGATWTIDNGVVGIAKLSATGTPSSTTYLRGDNTWATVSGGSNIYTADGTLTGNRTVSMSGNSLLFSGGTVKFGTSVPPTWDSLVDRVQVANGAIYGYQNESGILANSYYNGGWKYIANDFAGFYNLKSGQHIWYTAASGTANGLIAFSNKMVLTQAGRLLLGTTTESTFLLDVNGTARVSDTMTINSSSSNGVLVLNQTSIGFASLYVNRVNTTNAIAQISFSDLKTGANNRTFGLGIGRSGDPQWNNGDFIFGYYNGTGGWQQSAKIFNASGNWAIENGTATSDITSALLQVNSTTKGFLPPRLSTAQRDAIASPAAGLVVYDNTDNYLSLHNGTNWQNIVSPNSAGNVLINSLVDAGYKLQVTSATADNHLLVWGATAPSIRIDNASSAATQRFVFGLATATNNFIIGAVAGDICMTTQSSSPLLFGANATEVMRITTSSNLLINKTADGGQKLQVSGTVNFASLPTSATGLSAGDIWNNGGVLNIV